jgi:hypothetical protein
MEDSSNTLAEIFSNHPDTHRWMKMLNKTYLDYSQRLLLQIQGNYPISKKEFDKYILESDKVCFFILEESYNYTCYGTTLFTYYLIEELVHIRSSFTYKPGSLADYSYQSTEYQTYNDIDSTSTRSSVIKENLKPFDKSDDKDDDNNKIFLVYSECDYENDYSVDRKLLFSLETAYNLYSSRTNCVRVDPKYAINKTRGVHKLILELLSGVRMTLLLEDYLEMNSSITNNRDTTFNRPISNEITGDSKDKFKQDLSKYRNSRSEIFDGYHESIQKYLSV